jgi:hypothetical protein
MKYLILLFLCVLTACQVSKPIKHEQAQASDIKNYVTLSIDEVHFTQAAEYPGIEKTLKEKIKTEIFKQKMGDIYTDTPDEHTLIIVPTIEEYSSGQANMQLMFGVAGRSKAYGKVELKNTRRQTLYTMYTSATTPPLAIAAYANGDYLLDLTAQGIVEQVRILMKGTEQ